MMQIVRERKEKMEEEIKRLREAYLSVCSGRVPPDEVVQEALNVYDAVAGKPKEEVINSILSNPKISDPAKYLVIAAVVDRRAKRFLESRRIDPEYRRILGEATALMSSFPSPEAVIREEVQEAGDVGSRMVRFEIDLRNRDDPRLVIHKPDDRITKDVVEQILMGYGFSSKIVDPINRAKIQKMMAEHLINNTKMDPKKFVEMGGSLGAFGVGSTKARKALAGSRLNDMIVFRSGHDVWKVPVKALYLPAEERKKMIVHETSNEFVKGSIIEIPLDTKLRDVKGRNTVESVIRLTRNIVNGMDVEEKNILYPLLDLSAEFVIRDEDGSVKSRILRTKPPLEVVGAELKDPTIYDFSEYVGFPLVMVGSLRSLEYIGEMEKKNVFFFVDGALVESKSVFGSPYIFVLSDSLPTTEDRTSLVSSPELEAISPFLGYVGFEEGVKSYELQENNVTKITYLLMALSEYKSKITESNLPKDLYEKVLESEKKLENLISNTRVTTFIFDQGLGEERVSDLKKVIVLVSREELRSKSVLIDKLAQTYGNEISIVVGDSASFMRKAAEFHSGLSSSEIITLSEALNKYSFKFETKIVVDELFRTSNINSFQNYSRAVLMSKLMSEIPVLPITSKDVKGYYNHSKGVIFFNIEIENLLDIAEVIAHETAHSWVREHNAEHKRIMISRLAKAVSGMSLSKKEDMLDAIKEAAYYLGLIKKGKDIDAIDWNEKVPITPNAPILMINLFDYWDPEKAKFKATYDDELLSVEYAGGILLLIDEYIAVSKLISSLVDLALLSDRTTIIKFRIYTHTDPIYGIDVLISKNGSSDAVVVILDVDGGSERKAVFKTIFNREGRVSTTILENNLFKEKDDSLFLPLESVRRNSVALMRAAAKVYATCYIIHTVTGKEIDFE